jgi:hypothetical protein
MKIVLTRDLTGPKAVARGFVAGATYDWPRSVISSISEQEKAAGNDEDWFNFSTEVERSMRRVSAKNAKSEDVVVVKDEAELVVPKTQIGPKKATTAKKEEA